MVFQKFCLFFLPLLANAGPISDSEYADMPPVFHFDDYDNCMLYGKYALFCRIGFKMTPRNLQNTSHIWNTMQTLKKSKKYYDHTFLRHRVCVTKSCPDILRSSDQTIDQEFIEKLETCYNRKYEDIDLEGKIEYIRCETEKSLYDFSFFDYLFCVFLVVFISLVLFAWIYDLTWQPDLEDRNFMKTTMGKFVSSFSLSKNWKRLMRIDLENQDSKALSNIHGVRVYYLVSVIVTHSIVFNISLPVLNTKYTESIMDRNLEQYISIGGRQTTLQFFFLISSFLHCYKFLSDCTEKQTRTLGYLIRNFFNRYFRLIPMVALTTFFFATLAPHLARGPLWDDVVGDEYRACRTKWWYNLLYLNNFLPLHTMCLPHLWSLSVDLQFYALSIPILWLIFNYKKRTFLLLGSLWSYHVVQTFTSYYKKFSFLQITPEMGYNTTLVNLREYFILYKTTTTNMAGFIWGLTFGYIFYTHRNKKFFSKKLHTYVWWLISWTAILGPVLFPGFYIQFGLDGDLTFASYMALSRSIFSFGIGLFIFGMTQGQGYVIREFCEWPIMHRLGRLNFNAYLVHVCIQRVIVGLKRTPNFLSDYSIVFDSLGFVFTSYVASLFLTLFFDYPFVEIRKHITEIVKQKSGIKFDKKNR